MQQPAAPAVEADWVVADDPARRNRLRQLLLSRPADEPADGPPSEEREAA